ncbi:glycoside hydrolase family 97 protein [Undibacterium sp. Jales W-56]|uniref:glycoside hydrolase family 97 protein n=1 Tax=Undibacterium sp. Jales W-56 TaxID=2897325 RepID=UPI0021CE2782|nr:glycoside hydrolase family 97 protein [Undibacterium sp. Jales W-56]MCU6432587.1 glycoside hydrolase family 97 protein [Undibacterium sp. Jales W-56]
MKFTCNLAIVLTLFSGVICAATAQDLFSPDHQIQVQLRVNQQHHLTYAVYRHTRPVILQSELGLELDKVDLRNQLSLVATSEVRKIEESYSMAVGKRRHNRYLANEQSYTVVNASQQKMDVVFRVSNDGVAFRYIVADSAIPHKKLIQESSSFAFAANTQAWLQPIAVAQTGWSNTNPSYEELYQMGIAVGTASPSQAGWVFPALFKTGDTWVVLSEANMDGSYQASRLQADSTGGVYKIGNPMTAEVFTGGSLMAETDGVLTSPWRIIGLGSLNSVMNSNLGNDLAAPAIAFNPELVQPGHASWSWALLKDDSTIYEVQKKFIDYAADMHWRYTLIDADWDRKIGVDKVRELVDYAARKNVGILLWYNSSGAWNTTQYSPKGQLLTHEQRKKEFTRLQQMGVKGIKVDFFAGDGRSMIEYYLAILKDAADSGLLVNFHGATLPRGWARTYPNLMSMEAVKGLEFTTFTQQDQDAVVTHAAMLPFARNLFDPMDFTPMVFGDIPNIRRATKNGFELAESVLFLSGIQHFAEIPEGMATVPEYVKQFLQNLPRSWDDSKFIDGFPGKYVVIARQSSDAWYVAGINAEETDKPLQLDLSFIGNKQGSLMTDGASERTFARSDITTRQPVKITIKAHGGFVAVFR